MRKNPWVVATLVVVVVVLIAVLRHQVTVYQERRGREARARELRDMSSGEVGIRRALFAAVQPVALRNCTLQRFGEANDGGYLMCANLLAAVESGYSYGISGYDQWGCDISTKLGVPLHQYDCFDTRQPACAGGKTVFHAECVAEAKAVADARVFDSLENQLVKNGDRGRQLVIKMDVEGAEWWSLLSTPDDVLRRIDQLTIEFHWIEDPAGGWVHDGRYLSLIQRLKEHFHVAHLHFNNHSCVPGLEPFPAWAYEVLFVSKRLAEAEPSAAAPDRRRLDAPNDPHAPDCQPSSR
jgi:hypothetical protein